MGFGPAAAGFTYCLTFAFKSPSMCNLFIIISGFLIGMGGPLTALILRFIGEDPGSPNDSLVTAATAIEWILRPIPSFCLGKGLLNVINIESLEWLAGGDITVYHHSVLLWEVIFLALESVLYLFLAIFLDILSTNPQAVSV